MTLPATPAFAGLLAAPFTPLDADGGLLPERIPDHAALLAAGGVRGAFVCGTTGEGVSFTLEERKTIAACWREPAKAHGLSLIVHVGHLCLLDAQALARHAEQEIGADGISAIAPCFLRPANVDDLVDWCARVAEAAPRTPFFYYHFPTLTGLPFSMADFLPRAAARIPTLVGVKFTHDDLDDLRRCAEWSAGRLHLWIGRDEILLDSLDAGATGAVGSTYNFAAPLYRRLLAARERGDEAAARAEQDRALAFIAVMQRYGGMPAGKAIMNLIGHPCGPVRPPLRSLAPDAEAALRADLEQIGFFAFHREAG